MLVAIDADILLHQCAVVVEEQYEFRRGPSVRQINAQHARDLADYSIDTIMLSTKADAAVLAFSNDRIKNFRRDLVLPTYKLNRAGLERPLGYEPLRDYLYSKYECLSTEGIEADDLLGIMATDPFRKQEITIASGDKDLKTIPGRLFVPRTSEFFDIDEVDADRFHMLQTLSGDSVDEYKGCPSIGPKRGAKLLEGLRTYGEMWPVVVDAYERQGLTEEDALAQARCARILRWEDYDEENNEVILWKPPEHSSDKSIG